jgi:hypothetical protein
VDNLSIIVVLIIVAGILIWYFNKGKSSSSGASGSHISKADVAAQKQTEMQTMFDYIHTNQKLPIIDTSLNLKKGESAHLEDRSAVMLEERSVSVSNRGGGAVRVAKGFYLGGSQAVSRRHEEIKEIDSGQLTFTNQRIVFIGSTKTKQFSLNKITQIDQYEDGFSISYEGKEKKTMFRLTSEPTIWDIFFKIQNNINRGEPIPHMSVSVRPK